MAAEGVKASFTKLNATNYVAWKFRMQTLLEREEVWEAIEDEHPEEKDAKFGSWKKMDRKARNMIAMLVEDNQLRFIKKAETATEMWENLRVYHEKATISNQAMLLQQLCSTNLVEDGDMEQHIENVENLFERLDNAGVDLSELLRIIMLLRSLPPSYSSFVTSLENRSQDDLTMDIVLSRLRDESLKRENQTGAGNNAVKAMKVEVKNRNEKMKCFFCHQSGHFRRNCRKFQEAKKKNTSSAQQARQTDTKRFPENAQVNVCNTVCFMAGVIIPGAWTVDSGCTCHMTNDREFFTEFQNDIFTDVTLADGKKTKSTGCGNGVIFGMNDKGKRIAIKMENVLYVPDLEGGLISVRKLAMKGFNVVFDEKSCKIVSNKGDVIVCEIQGNLYKLKMAEQCMVATANHTNQCQHTWHRRLGHRTMNVIESLQEKGLADGVSIHDCGIREVCEVCLKGKLSRLPFPTVTERKSKKPLDLVHTDLCGPMENPTPSGSKYFMAITDDYSRFCVVFLLRSKDETTSKIKEYVRRCENVFGRKPSIIRSDGGGEYTANVLQQFYKTEGIKAQYSTPYSPQSNGIAERKNRSLQEMANCMLLEAGLPKRYWGEAVLTAAYLQNRLPSRAVDRTPYELWTGYKPDLSMLRVFGSEAYVHIPDGKRNKFEPKAKKMIFLGYSANHKGYRLVDVTTDQVTISRDVRFLEHGVGPRRLEEHRIENVTQSTKEIEEVFVEPESEEETFSEHEEAESFYEDAQEDTPAEECSGRTHRSTRGKMPSHLENFVVGKVTHDEEPNDHHEAMRVPEWRKAMQEEIEAHDVNLTWELVNLPENRKTIGAKWVFKLKRDETGKIIRHKARIVAQGYSQKYGDDYTDVFAPVTRQTTLRMMIAVAAKKGLVLKQFDVKTAYLNGIIEEELYMRQPPGFITPGQEGLVCKLRKSIYGLKQSARSWNRVLHAVLLKLGFMQCESDPCLYVSNSGNTVYLLVYVDDLLIGSAEEAEIDRIFESLREEFDITPLGFVKHFLGYEIEKKENCYTLALTSYIRQLIVKFGMEEAYPAKTPMDTGYTSLNECSKPFSDKTRYRSLIGALMYLAVNTRPDVSLSAGLLGRKVENPNESDWAAAKRVVRYLKGTLDNKLQYGPGSGWELRGYSDADWAGDKQTRKSTSGFVFFYGGGPVCWTSKVQASVALSSLEAEYNALSLACQEAVWLRRLLSDFGEPQNEPTTLHEDNQGCISFATAERSSGRVKHIDTKRNFIRELKEQKAVRLIYCPSNQMVADALTKPLSSTHFDKFSKQMFF